MSETEATDVPIRDSTIRLGQLLKLANLADDGATAKELIENGMVRVNNSIEERRGRQLQAGDVVSAAGQSVRIVPASD